MIPRYISLRKKSCTSLASTDFATKAEPISAQEHESERASFNFFVLIHCRQYGLGVKVPAGMSLMRVGKPRLAK